VRICEVAGAFSPLSQAFIYDFVGEAERQGSCVHVLTFRRQNEAARPFPRVAELQMPRDWRGIPRVFPAWALKRQRRLLSPHLTAQLEQIAPDIVHAQFGTMGFYVMEAARELHIPLVTAFHGIDAYAMLTSRRWRQAFREVFEASSKIAVVSEHMKNALLAAGAPAAKLSVVRVGVSLRQFPCTAPLERFDGKKIEVVSIGRFVEKKDPLGLIRAFHKCLSLIKTSREVRLLMAGDGPLLPAAKYLARRLGLARQVDFLGALDHDNLPAFIGGGHIYAQHSVTAADGDREGIPVSLMEAAASGLPIVATAHSGIPELVSDGRSGFLVQERDYEGMARRMAALIDSPESWPSLGAAGREIVSENFDIEKQTAKMIKLFSDCIG